jgi:heat shock factor-binding protein 1
MAEKSYKGSEDPSTKELNAFVQNLLKQMQERFEDMSGNIVGRIDEMGKCFSNHRPSY